MMKHMDADFIIAHPEGYTLNPIITKDRMYDRSRKSD